MDQCYSPALTSVLQHLKRRALLRPLFILTCFAVGLAGQSVGLFAQGFPDVYRAVPHPWKTVDGMKIQRREGSGLMRHRQSPAEPLPSAYDSYRVQLINPPAGADPLGAWMNGHGMIVLSYQYFDANGGEQGSAVLEHGLWTVLESGGTAFWAQGQPSTSGKVPGSYFVPELPGERGAFYQNGKYSLLGDLPSLAGHSWRIYAVNTRGWVSALRWDPTVDEPAQAVLLDPSLNRVYSLEAPFAEVTFPRALNSRNEMAGVALCPVDGYARYSGVWLSGGRFTRVDAPGDGDTYLAGLNERGEAVGYYTPVGAATRGLISHNGRLWDFFIPGSQGTMIDAITDNGELSGTVHNQDGTDSIFVAGPRPLRTRF